MQAYIDVLSEEGNDPIDFVIDKFQNHDLLIFDDAYDALIFLGPVEKMHKTALVDFIYTNEFKKEVERRYRILYTEEQIQKEFDDYGVNDLKELIEKTFVAEPQKLLPQSKLIEPIDAWKERKN